MSFYAFDCLAGQRYQERWGLDFEEFAAGQRFRHRPGVTVSQQDNTDEALDTFNAAMLHYDAQYTAHTVWKKPLMVSTITLQRTIGMASRTFGRRRHITGFREIQLSAPVFGGDTLYSESEILDCAEGDSETGLVTVVSRAINQDGKTVATLTYDVEVYRRGKHPDDAEAQGVPAAEPRFALYRTLEDGSLLEQYGIFYEDAQAGDIFMHAPRRHFRREEAIEHSMRSLEVSPQYHDLAWINRNQDGRYRIAETWLISAATALTTRTFGRVVANLGWYDIRLPCPVHAGDTVSSESTIVEKRESKSRPNEGILTVDTRSFNQQGVEVLSYRRKLLVYRRNAETPYGKAGY